jgi:hypothetical protein
MSNDTDITEREERVAEIIDRLESTDLTLAEAKRLRDEADDHLTELRRLVDLDEGTVDEYDD